MGLATGCSLSLEETQRLLGVAIAEVRLGRVNCDLQSFLGLLGGVGNCMDIFVLGPGEEEVVAMEGRVKALHLEGLAGDEHFAFTEIVRLERLGGVIFFLLGLEGEVFERLSIMAG